MDWTAIIGAGSAGAVLVIGKIIDWYRERKRITGEEDKQKAEDRRTDERVSAEVSIPINDQAVKVYKDIVDTLRADTATLRKGLEEMEKRYLEAKEEVVTLKARVEVLQGRVSELEARKPVKENPS